MAAEGRSLVLLLVLFAVSAEAAAAGGSPSEEQKLIVPGTLDPGQITVCWSSVLSIPNCSAEILTSFLTFRIKVGPQCCQVLDKIGNDCFLSIFGNAPFNPFFPRYIKSFCSRK